MIELSSLLQQVPSDILNLSVAVVLGLFIGLEREWAEKPAGVRTFALIALVGGVLASTGSEIAYVAGIGLTFIFAILLGAKDIVQVDENIGLSLTTSVALLTTYSVGVLAGLGNLLQSVFVAITASFLLLLKGELHGFALGLTKDEVRSATEFAIIAFVIYPLLPTENFGPENAVNPRLVWSLVIAVSALGFVNYILVRRYEERGFAATGFFGGLVNSTAVVGAIADKADSADTRTLGIGAILLANAAMAIRNTVIIAGFLPESAIQVGLPLGILATTGIIISIVVSDWSAELETTIESPFSVKKALMFGTLFLGILVATAVTTDQFGQTGFIVSAFISGLISSGTATTTAVTLASTGQITVTVASYGVIAGTAASILAKLFFVATIDRSLVKPLTKWSFILILTGIISALALTII